MTWTDLLWATAALLVLLYFFLTSNFDYFEQKRVPYRRPLPLLGNMGPLVFKKKSLAVLSQDFYHQFKSFGMGGVFEYRKPVTIICEPEVVQQVYMKEYENMVDHNASLSDDADGLFQKSIVVLSGQHWRDMRSTLKPVFCAAKLGAMLPQVGTCARRAVELLGEAASRSATAGGTGPLEVELEDLFRRMTTDAFASAGFGVSCNSLEEPRGEFCSAALEAADSCGRRAAVQRAYALLPDLMRLLGVRVLSAGVEGYFRSLVHAVTRGHERGEGAGGAGAAAALHQLVAARHGGAPDAAAQHKDEDTRRGALKPRDLSQEFSDDDIAAQVVLLLTKGLEPTTALLSFAAYLLALHPAAQERVREEATRLLAADGGRLSLDALGKTEYLDMVISETLRMYPPSPVSALKCTHTFAVKGTDKRSGFVMRPGDELWLPIYALHNDPEHFPDPDMFDPERFSQTNQHKIAPFTFVPFGGGPRSCMGMEFAMMQVKVVLVYLLSRFNIKVTDKTPYPLKLSKNICRMTVDEGFWVGLELRKEVFNVHV